MKKVALALGILTVLFVAIYWLKQRESTPRVYSANGRIEAVEITVASKRAGRVEEILVDEGDFVHSGQIIARLDTAALQAEHRQAEAQYRQAQSQVATARSQLAQRRSEKAAAEAVVTQSRVELDNARKHAARTLSLVEQGAVTRQKADDDSDRVQSALAAVASARAQVSACEAAIAAARIQIDAAEASVTAARATVERIVADLDDTQLKAPRDARVQYRIVQPGEVVGAGGRVLSLVDLTDVYMTFFLPTKAAGRVALGSEVRLVLDAAPNYVIPATVSYVADVAQFTPKTVETANEREKLMFRIKAQLPLPLLEKHVHQVKTGLPGMAYLRLDDQLWPEHLNRGLVQ